MSKPLTIARHDFEEELKHLAENAELPAFAIVDALQNMLLRITPMIEAQYQEELARIKSDSEKE